MLKKLVALILTFAMAIGISTVGFASSDGLTDVSFRLNYTAAGHHAPFYMALEKGYYEEAGLNVVIGEGTGSGTTAKLIGSGSDDIGYVDSASVANAIASEIPIRIVAPVYAVNGFAAMTLADSGIETIQDLAGKRIGITTGDAPSNLFAAVEGANGIDDSTIEYITMDANAKVTALVQKQVDVILGGADDQAITLEQMGQEVTVLRYSENGAATVGLSIIASDDMIANHSDVLQAFISASMRAWDEARENPDEALEYVLKKFPTMDKEVARGQLDVALNSLFTDNSIQIGNITDEDWESCRNLLVDYLGIDESIQATDLYTRECLPEELPAR